MLYKTKEDYEKTHPDAIWICSFYWDDYHCGTYHYYLNLESSNVDRFQTGGTVKGNSLTERSTGGFQIDIQNANEQNKHIIINPDLSRVL